MNNAKLDEMATVYAKTTFLENSLVNGKMGKKHILMVLPKSCQDWKHFLIQ